MSGFIILRDGRMVTGSGITSESAVGLVLALSSSIFIGSSFIIKKKGLLRAGLSGVRAGVDVSFTLLQDLFVFHFRYISVYTGIGGYAYLEELSLFSCFCGYSFHRSWRVYLLVRATLVGWHDHKYSSSYYALCLCIELFKKCL